MAADPNLLVTAAALLGVVLSAAMGGAVALGPVLKRRRAVRQRLTGLARHRRGLASESRDALLAKPRRQVTGIEGVLERLMPRREMLEFRLRRTGRSITIGQYLAVSVAIGVAAGIIFGRLLHLGLVPGLLCGVLAGIGLPHLWIGRLGKQRVARFMSLLPDAVELMVRALRSGLPISEAIVNAGHEVADPVGEEFRLVESGLRLGRELDDVLWDTARRLDIPEFRFFVISLGVQRETGGNLAETLATLADMLRRRRQMKLKIKALSSEARASAMILGCLPFLVIAAMTVTSPDYIGRLFTDPRGLLLCGLGILFMLTGILTMAKLIHFDI